MNKPSVLKLLVVLFFLSILPAQVYALTPAQVKPGVKPVTDGRSQTEWLKHATELEDMEDWRGLLDWSTMWTKKEPKNKYAWLGLGNAYKYL